MFKLRIPLNLLAFLIGSILIVNSGYKLARASDISDHESSSDSDNQLNVDNIDQMIIKFKRELMPCRKLLDIAFSLAFNKNDIHRIENGLRRCEGYYTGLIENILDDLGLIGRAIRKWLSILNEFAISEPNKFKNLVAQDLQLISVLYEKLDPSVYRNQLHPDEIYYLETAFLYGLGICTHMKTGPLKEIMMDVLSFWLYRDMLDTEIGADKHEFVFIREIEDRLDERGQVHLMALMRSLNTVCKSFIDHPVANSILEIRRIIGEQESLDQDTFDWLLFEDLEIGLSRRAIQDILAPPRDRTCNQADFYRFKKGLKFMLSLHIDDQSLANSNIQAGASIFIETCYRQIVALLLDQQQISKLIPDVLSTYQFSTMVREKLNRDFIEDLRIPKLETRAFLYTSPAERLFFELPGKTRSIDAKESEAAYMDGRSGPCKFYAQYTKLYQQKDGIFELIELFTFMDTLEMIRYPISNDATGFYIMWTLCRENRLLEMNL